ncbi:MAG TPA: bifunctional phosphoglucose/phosphomannose isomerase [Solirubrobacteraceae bacterium]|nr:bifunctional phosphoglucose/phosphomannose isomerase [Solirubrobacteraceae bacterium]
MSSGGAGDPGAPTALTGEAIAAVDRSGQLNDVLALGEHLRDALWRVESAGLEPADSAGGLVIAGMGGSAIGGALARAVLGDRASRPISVWRDYGLPDSLGTDATVLCCSYSGATEETLAAYEAAGALGVRRIVCTSGGALAVQARTDGVPVIPLPGGFAPRAAVGYGLVVALEVAALAGAAIHLRTEIDVAAEHAMRLAERWGPDASEDSLAKSLARSLAQTIVQIGGAGLTAPIAYRWKTQLNENAGTPAFAGRLPELDHNEIVGWEAAPMLGRFSVVMLDDCDLHPRVRERIALTLEVIGERAVASHRIQTLGSTRIERLISLVLLGDLVSIYVAVLRGRDPASIEPIDELKRALASGDADSGRTA